MNTMHKMIIAAGLLTASAVSAAPTVATNGGAISATTQGGQYSFAVGQCAFLQQDIYFGLSANVGGALVCNAGGAGMAVGTVSFKGQGRSYSLTTAGGNSILETSITKPADLAAAGTAALTAANAADAAASY